MTLAVEEKDESVDVTVAVSTEASRVAPVDPSIMLVTGVDDWVSTETVAPPSSTT